MSRIFDAVQKDNIIDFGGICHAGDPIEAEPPAREPIRVRRSALPPPDLERVVQLNVLPSSPLLPFGGNQHAVSEQYRIIRTKILHRFKKPQLIVVSSASSGDGKTVTSINIA